MLVPSIMFIVLAIVFIPAGDALIPITYLCFALSFGQIAIIHELRSLKKEIKDNG